MIQTGAPLDPPLYMRQKWSDQRPQRKNAMAKPPLCCPSRSIFITLMRGIAVFLLVFALLLKICGVAKGFSTRRALILNSCVGLENSLDFRTFFAKSAP